MKRILTILLLGLFLVSFTSAFEFDNWMNYDEQKEEIIITNAFNLGDDLIKAKLNENTDDGRYGRADKTITLYEPGVLIEDFKTIRLDDGSNEEQNIRWYKFEYWGTINDYEYICRETDQVNKNGTISKECSNELIGSHEGWIEFKEGDEFDAGVYHIQTTGEIKPGRVYDWQIKIAGKWTTPWAVWGNISLGDDAEVILNSPSNGETVYQLNNMFNASANVTGGATMVNMSLWTNESGSWELRNNTNEENIVLGTENWKTTSDNAGFSSTSSYFWTNMTANYDGIIKTVSVITGNSGDTGSVTVKIFQNNVELASVTENFPSSQVVNVTFEQSDYSDYIYKDINDGNFSIKTIKGTCSDLRYKPSLSYGGTYFSASNQNKAWGHTDAGDNYIVFEANNTLPSTTQTWNRTITDNIIWNVQACDSDGDCGFAPLNYTLLIDSTAPVISNIQGNGTNNYGALSINKTLNFTATDVNLDSCWIEYNNTNKTYSCSSGVKVETNFTLESGVYNATIYANDSVGNLSSQFVEWDYKIFEKNRTYNSSVYETAYENYQINLTANSSLTAVKLNYGGTDYSMINAGSGIWYYSRDLPTSSVGTNDVYFKFTYAGHTINSYTTNQTVSEILFGLCNATLTNDFLNISFKDEADLLYINASIQASVWEYYLGTGTESKSYLFSNVTENPSYTFCATPTDHLFYSTVQMNYLADTYPTRIWQPTLLTLTSTVTNQILYLLSQDDGIYTTFITATQGNTPIEGVLVTATRSIGGSSVIVAQGTSDSSGSVTFWLNPNYDHSVSASKEGYGSGTVSVRPTQSTYTITLSSALENYTYINNYEGLKWFVFPSVGIRNESTSKNYGFNITAENDNIIGCKIEITDNSKNILLASAETIASNSSECSVQVSYTVNETYPKIKGRLLIDVGEGYQLLEDDAYWALLTFNSTGMTFTDWFNSIKEFDLSYFNNNEQHREYTQILLFFLVAMIICAGMNVMGWDIQTNGGMIYLIGALVILASIPGFLTLNYISPYVWIDQYFVAIVYTFFMIGFGLRSIS